jgi:Fe2+ or Zn2+ uptake regulation protein
MIEKDYNTKVFTVHCEGCDETEEIDTNDDWQAMIAELKARGWKIVKTKDGWDHYCPTCADPSNMIGA